MNYNPNEPCTVGLEWFSNRKGIVEIASNSDAIGMKLVAETSDSVDQVWTFLRQEFGGFSVAVFEVFDITAGLPVLDPISTTTYYPGGDRWFPGLDSGWRAGSFNGSGPSAPFWDVLDNPVLVPSTWPPSGQYVDNDEFVYNFFGAGYELAIDFNGVVGTQAGRWITKVRSWANCAQYLTLGAAGAFQIQPYLMFEGEKRKAPAMTVDAATGPTAVYYDWRYNPITGLPWTPADIDGFDETVSGSGQMGMGWTVQPTGSSNNLATILQAQLQIESAPTDPRLVIGSTIFPPGDTVGWQPVLFKDPADSAVNKSLDMIAGHEYLFLLRKGGGLSNLAVPYLDSTEGPLPGPPTWTSFVSTPNPNSLTLDADSLRPVQLGAESTAAFPIILQTFGGPDPVSDDSQPYMTSSALGGQLDAFPALARWFDNSIVSATRSIRQDFTPTATDEYGWIWVLLAQVSSAGVGADLTITIRDDATDTMQGQPFVITSADVEEPRNAWQRTGMRMPGIAPTLTSGTLYYFDITTTAETNRGWLVQVLMDGVFGAPFGEGIHPPLGADEVVYGGLTDQLSIGDPLAPFIGAGAVITISTSPDPVENFTAIAAGAVCCVDSIVLTWTPTEDIPCGGFLAYEIQRRDDVDATWRQIAYITDELVGVVRDRESRRGHATDYRIRVIRGDRSPSDWSATQTATASMAGCVGLIFTSNAAPELTVFYQDIPNAQTRDFQFPRNYSVFEPQGEDGAVVYSELPDRLVRFNRKVRLRDGHDPCLPECDDGFGIGMQVFDPLKDISRAGIPYVCIHDESGNRWFAFVDTPTGQWTQHGVEVEGGWAAYTMDIVVVEETKVPAPFDAIFEPGS